MSEVTRERCGDCDLLFFCRPCLPPDGQWICLDRLSPGSRDCAAARAYARAPRAGVDGSPADDPQWGD